MDPMLTERVSYGDMSGHRVGFDAGGPTGDVIGDDVSVNASGRLFHEFIAGSSRLKRNGEATGFVVTSGH